MKFTIFFIALAGAFVGFCLGVGYSASRVDERVQSLQNERDHFEEKAARFKMEAEGICETKSEIHQQNTQERYFDI